MDEKDKQQTAVNPVVEKETAVETKPVEAETANSTSTKMINPGLNNLKEFATPIAIMIAGIFIGAGMYFSGGKDTVPTAPVQPTAAPADNTNKIDAVTADEHIKGDPNAPIKVVEFSDFDCPFCARFHDVMNEVVKNSDDVAWVYRQFPLQQLHPEAPKVALASECAADLGGNDAFWEFADGYIKEQAKGAIADHDKTIEKLAREIGLNMPNFNDCLSSERLLADVQKDIDDAVETGGRGTPWSIIITPSGKTYPINGALPQQAVEQLIEVARNEG